MFTAIGANTFRLPGTSTLRNKVGTSHFHLTLYAICSIGHNNELCA